MLNAHPDVHSLIGVQVARSDMRFYCLRSDYPQPKRVLHEMALSDKIRHVVLSGCGLSKWRYTRGVRLVRDWGDAGGDA
jgi:hypothetical protein